MKPLIELTGYERILALSVKEPYGSLILHHNKKETRTWAPNTKGYLLLCGSKEPYSAQSIREISGDIQVKRICEALGASDASEFNRYCGYAFAVGKLSNCRPMLPTDENDCFVKYYDDLFCWEFEKVYAIEPFKWKGTQGLTVVPHETVKQIMLL
jgi:hypothetical protein